MTYDDLNDLVLSTAEKIEELTGQELSTDDRIILNDKLGAYLEERGVELVDE